MARRRAVLFAAIAAAVVALDQVSKAVVRSSMALYEQIPLVDGVLWLTHVRNTGGAFGILQGQRWLFLVIGVSILCAITFVIVRMRPRGGWVRLALALVTAGAIGNVIDRIVFGGVTDFFDLGWWPVFNVADIALDVGTTILVGWLLFSRDHRGSEGDGPSAREGDAPAEAGDGMVV